MRLIYSILKQFSNRDLLHIRKLITDILSIKLPYREQSRLFWDNNGYTRNLRISPANPSEDDLRLYKKYLTDGGNNKKVLLLGSTPLLRYLLSESGFKNYVVADFSFATIENSLWALDKLGIDLNSENEIWLKTDWLEMPLEPQSYDCVIGDMVFTQIEPGQQPLFVKKISSLLKQNGNFIVRMCTCNTDFNDVDPQKIIEGILFSETSAIEQRFALLYRLRDRLRNSKTQTTSPSTIINELLKYQTSDEKKLDFLRSVAKMISKRAEMGLPFVTQLKNELDEIISKEFLLEASATASDYAYDNFPIYILRKKI
ncbi:MAG: hypothetical protein UU33_C0007G0004 [Candidatus Azambacteria bacterium GW2011_GWF1_41_10]|nr:MAG: hypothetical protein UU33_C0007G0004 [Candidatus Azambacteria bacterium GW2011_GWF1_41_10]KKT12969.1 MAG: hypothetical protein UV94_C0036G0006 [Parcubacteria group bacterium GW2011_GWC1_43_30]